MEAGRPPKWTIELKKNKITLENQKVIKVFSSTVRPNRNSTGAYITVPQEFKNYEVYIFVLKK